jgi:hypothetical protein
MTFRGGLGKTVAHRHDFVGKLQKGFRILYQRSSSGEETRGVLPITHAQPVTQITSLTFPLAPAEYGSSSDPFSKSKTNYATSAVDAVFNPRVSFVVPRTEKLRIFSYVPNQAL